MKIITRRVIIRNLISRIITNVIILNIIINKIIMPLTQLDQPNNLRIGVKEVMSMQIIINH